MSQQDYERVERAIRFIDENFRRQPDLAEIAGRVGLSEHHFQRLFRRWAGVTPKRFLQFVTADHALRLLQERRTVLDTAYETGLSGPGRLHDLMVSMEAMTPGEVSALGAGLVVRFGYAASPFGECLVAMTDRGICGLTFVDGQDRAAAMDDLRRSWPRATLRPDESAAAAAAERIFAPSPGGEPLPLHVRGTNFQVKVWEALLRIPAGTVTTYQALAEGLGSASAARAVGTAIGSNPIAYVVPCHRVIRKTGAFGGYRWGADRKRAILGWEIARAE
jgi:AraC family transcriptional regulator of adaptative response/methylated-DNA-[protein]-cysteine methyltransferase